MKEIKLSNFWENYPEILKRLEKYDIDLRYENPDFTKLWCISPQGNLEEGLTKEFIIELLTYSFVLHSGEIFDYDSLESLALCDVFYNGGETKKIIIDAININNNNLKFGGHGTTWNECGDWNNLIQQDDLNNQNDENDFVGWYYEVWEPGETKPTLADWRKSNYIGSSKEKAFKMGNTSSEEQRIKTPKVIVVKGENTKNPWANMNKTFYPVYKNDKQEKLIEVYNLSENKKHVIIKKDILIQTNVEKALEQILIDQPIEFSKCYIPTDIPTGTPQRIKMEILTQEKTHFYLKNKIYDLIGIQFEVEVLPTSLGGWSIWIEEKELGIDERRELTQKIKDFAGKNSYFSCDTDIEDLDISETLEFSTRKNGDVGSEKYSDVDLQEAYLLRKKLSNNFFPKLKMENIEVYPVDEWIMMSINFNVIKENIKIFGEYNNKQYDLSDAIDLVNGNNYSSSEDFSLLTRKLAKLKDKKTKEWGYALTKKFAPKTGGLTEILNKIIEEISLN